MNEEHERLAYERLIQAMAWLHTDEPDRTDEYTRGQLELICDTFPVPRTGEDADSDKDRIWKDMLAYWKANVDPDGPRQVLQRSY